MTTTGKAIVFVLLALFAIGTFMLATGWGVDETHIEPSNTPDADGYDPFSDVP